MGPGYEIRDSGTLGSCTEDRGFHEPLARLREKDREALRGYPSENSHGAIIVI